jgi:arsenite methyltransferase
MQDVATATSSPCCVTSWARKGRSLLLIWLPRISPTSKLLREMTSAHANVQTQVGSILSLPFDDATFDCVWSANVMQYLTQAEFEQAIAEFKRVLKPGATLAIKEFDATLLQFHPMDIEFFGRFMAARRAKFVETGILGTSFATSIPSRLRRLGMPQIARKGWLIEHWAPLKRDTRQFVEDLLTFLASKAEEYDLPASDLERWRGYKASPGDLLDVPDFCFREFFVLTTGRLAP